MGRRDQVDGIVKTPASSLPDYQMTVRLLPEAQRLEAQGTVRLSAAADAREHFEICLSELMHDLAIEVVEPAVSAGAASLETREAPRGRTVWIVRPPRPVPAGEKVVLRFSYAGGEKTSFVFAIRPECSFAGGANTPWYPQLVGVDPRGTGTLRFVVSAGYIVCASGRRRGGARAAARGEFEFALGRPALFSFAVARYTTVRRAGSIPVSAFLLRSRRTLEDHLDGCAKILEVLAREFGPYPYGEFALVEAPSELAAEAGFTGASHAGFMLSDSAALDARFNLAFYAHEIGHQWWGNLVTLAGPRGRFILDEGMAQFGSLLAVEKIEGAEAAEQFRRSGYPGYPSYQSGLGYLTFASAGLDHPLAELPASPLSHSLADSKGFFVLDMLSRTVGRERFRRTLRAIARDHAFRSITWERFLAAVQAGAGRDLQWFHGQWFERAGAPDFHLDWRQSGKLVRGVITQARPAYRVDADLEVAGGDGQRLAHRVQLRDSKTAFAVPVRFRATSVEMDPHFRVLRWTDDYRAQAAALAPWLRAEAARWQGPAARGEEAFEAALKSVPVPDRYAARFLIEFGLGRLLAQQKDWERAKFHLQASLASPTRRADTLPWVYLQLAKVARALSDEALFREAAEGVISADAADGGRSGAPAAVRALPAGDVSRRAAG